MTRSARVMVKVAMPLLVLALTEFVARDVLDLRSRVALAERHTMAAYKGQPWAAQYFTDLRDCTAQSARAHQRRFSRYLLQDINEDCATPTVNYAHRMRQTWNPAEASRTFGVSSIGMFGGSTMEGIGAIDDETIPSEFSRLINTTGTGVFRVENYGVSGYTFTQSVMKLVTLLQQGKHFDAVVFYDGANDIDYAYELGEAGALDGEDVAETRIEGGLVSRSALFVKEEMNACVLCMTAGIIARHTPVLQDHITPAIVRLRDAIHFKKGAASDQDPSRMADDIAEYYARTHALLSAIADAYQIPHLEFWQPSLMYDDAYGPGEASLALMDPRLTDPRLRSLYRHTRDDELARRLPDFHDLTHVLDRREKAVYVDAVHLVGDGNRQVARAMFEAWLAVPSRPAAHRPQ